jgi:hypothetical protein
MNDKYLDMMRQYMGMNNRFTGSDLNGMGPMLRPKEFYQEEIPKTAFDSETLARMIERSMWPLSRPVQHITDTKALERVLTSNQYIDFNTELRNCVPSSFFEPHEIVMGSKSFEVTWERFREYCEQHTLFAVATIIDTTNPNHHTFDVIFIESGKNTNAMTPFIYTDSFRRSCMGLNGPMMDEIVHIFKNEYTGWSFCIVRTVSINAVQRVTSLPTSPAHPTTHQGVIDQNEIARIIKQFTDDLDNGAYHIE